MKRILILLSGMIWLGCLGQPGPDVAERKAAAANAAMEDWGPLVRGIRAQLTAVNEPYTVGQPMLFRLEMRNENAIAVHLDARRAAGRGAFIIRDEEGQQLSYAGNDGMMGDAILNLGAGERTIVFDNLNLRSRYSLNRPGHYLVQHSGSGFYIIQSSDPANSRPRALNIPSNIVNIKVDPKYK